MASGFTAAQTGRTHDRTRPMLQQLRKFLPRRRRPHMSQDLMNVRFVWFVRWNNGMHAKFNSQQYATKGTIRQ
jgi:hypothetical protein